MATAPIEFAGLPTGLTLTATLYPRGSDTAAVSGLSLTERTNSKGIYRTTTTAALTGWHRALVLQSTDVIAMFDVWMTDATDDHYAHDDTIETLHPATRGRAPVVDASGLIDSNVVKLGPSGSGTAQTARDIGASVLVGDKTGFSLSAAGVQAIWDALTSALTTVGSVGKRIVDYLDAAVSSRLATASYTAPLDSTATQSAAAAAITAYDPPTNAEMEARTLVASNYATASALATVASYLDTEIAAILEDTGTTLPAQIAALNNLSAAQVNAEVVDALNVDTYGESTGVPSATDTLVAKIKFLATLARNKQTRTATTATLLADNGTTPVATATLSDDGTTFVRTEWV